MFKTTTEMATAIGNEVSLKTIFHEALKNYTLIEDGSLPGNEQQSLIKRTISLLEETTRLINIGEIYSSNEMFEEVSTECIQYLATPCMLGYLVSRLTTGDRYSHLEVSEIYYKDFLKRGKEYGFVPESMKIDVDVALDKKDLKTQVLDRNAKIRKYEEQKNIKSNLIELKENLERADDEVQRKYYTLFVQSMVILAEEELRSIAMEKPLALMRKNDPQGPKRPTRADAPPPLKPIIITRNELQKKVYGLGYPSLPTMTVDEFYEERVREGIFPASGSNHAKAIQDLANPEIAKSKEEEEEIEKELNDEADDPDQLRRAREMDEYKDEHRRGWGNRYNRS